MKTLRNMLLAVTVIVIGMIIGKPESKAKASILGSDFKPGIYSIVDQFGNYLTVSEDKIGASVYYAPYDSDKSMNQKFIIIKTGNGYAITTRNGYAIDIIGYNPKHSEEKIWLYNYTGLSTQIFDFVSIPKTNGLTGIVSLADERTMVLAEANYCDNSGIPVNISTLDSGNKFFYITPVQYYERELVVEFIRRAYNTTYQACASLASCSLVIGHVLNPDVFAVPTSAKGAFGLRAKICTVGALWNYLLNNNLAVAEKVEFKDYNRVKNTNIQPGDFLVVRTGSTGNHIAVVSEVVTDSEGSIIYFCQRNKSRLDKKLSKDWAKCWNNKAECYVLKITF